MRRRWATLASLRVADALLAMSAFLSGCRSLSSLDDLVFDLDDADSENCPGNLINNPGFESLDLLNEWGAYDTSSYDIIPGAGRFGSSAAQLCKYASQTDYGIDQTAIQSPPEKAAFQVSAWVHTKTTATQCFRLRFVGGTSPDFESGDVTIGSSWTKIGVKDYTVTATSAASVQFQVRSMNNDPKQAPCNSEPEPCFFLDDVCLQRKN